MGLSKDQIYNADETGLLEMPSAQNRKQFQDEKWKKQE
jgi:hypothetical protein